MLDLFEGLEGFSEYTDSATAKRDIDYLINKKRIPIIGKGVLDIGMGPGYMFEYLQKIGADVYGFDTDKGWFGFNHIPGKTFFDVVANMPPELYGTISTALQYRLLELSRNPDDPKSFNKTIEATAKALVPNGHYVASFIDDQVHFKNNEALLSYEGKRLVKILENKFKKIEIEKMQHGRKNDALVIASSPILLSSL